VFTLGTIGAGAYDRRQNLKFEKCIATGDLLELAIAARQVIKMESDRMISFFRMNEFLAAIVASI